MSYNDENKTYDESYYDVGHNSQECRSYINISVILQTTFDGNDNDIDMSIVNVSLAYAEDLGYLHTCYVDGDYNEYYDLEMMYYV